MRITVNTPEAAAQVARIREMLDRNGVGVPLVGDFHYNGHKLLTQYPDCAKALDSVKAHGFRVIDEAPRPGSRGTTVAFVHPKTAFGTLIELVQE